MLKAPHSDAQELQDRLRKHGGPFPVTFLAQVAIYTRQLSDSRREAVRLTSERYRGYTAPTFWPCHTLWDMLEVLIRPESGKADIIVDFFQDVAGLEFLRGGRRNPSWFKPKPSLVLATVATIEHRQRFLRRLKGFHGSKALTDAELWVGLAILDTSVYARNDILKALRDSSIGDMCEYCHRLLLRKRKYCSDACMQASNDLKKQVRRKTKRPA